MLPHQNPIPNSKVYLNRRVTIPMNKDTSHRQLTQTKVEDKKEVQEKKQIDKMLSNIVKERLFGSFLAEDTKLSLENAYNIDAIYKDTLMERVGKSRVSFKDHSRGSLYNPNTKYGEASPRVIAKPSITPTCGKMHRTIEYSFNSNQQSLQQTRRHSIDRTQHSIQTTPRVLLPRKRINSQRLPSIQQIHNSKNQLMNPKIQQIPRNKLSINEKIFSDTFRKWAGASSNQLTYDLRVTREQIISKIKASVNIESRLLERFFHFFMFPPSFNLRQYCNLVEAAANTHLKFIHFFVFTLLDQHRNGILTSQDFFRFIQVYWTENSYIENQLFELQRCLGLREKTGVSSPEEKEGDGIVEEVLVLNHNIKMDQLKILLKESTKERIDVECPKNTCYHQTVLSLQHDPLERIKKGQIENTQLANQQINQQAKKAQKNLENTPGLRLRDFFRYFQMRRPKLFTALLQLLVVNMNPQDYE